MSAGKAAGMSFANDFGAERIGQQLGQQLSDALLGPVVAVVSEGKGGMNERVIRGAPQWQAIGTAIGQAIGTGVETALGQIAIKSLRDLAHTLGHKLQDISNQIFSSPLGMLPGALGIAAGLGGEAQILESFDVGGKVPGGPGEPRLAVIHGGELILNAAQQTAVSRALDSADQILEPFIAPTSAVLASAGVGTGGGGLSRPREPRAGPLAAFSPFGSNPAVPQALGASRVRDPEIVTLLREHNRLLGKILDQGAAGTASSTGVEALVHELVERGAANRRRIGAGAFGR